VTKTAAPLPDRLEKLDELELHGGGHSSFEAGHCAMELVAWLAGEDHSDHPECTSPVLTGFLVRLNDRLDDKKRQLLKPYLPRVIGTRDGKDDLRRRMAAEWTIKTSLPQWLELAGLTNRADELRSMEITDWTPALADLLRTVREECWAARTAARDRLEDKILAELKKHAGAGAAAVAAAAAGAGAAAGAAAVAAAGAGAGRWDTVYNAVYEAVKPKMVEYAEEKVAPLSAQMLPSALELLDRMIDPEPIAA
jgi:ribosomal protein L12E/L44/L45/RPP1/RPP2